MAAERKNKIALSIDLEDWYHTPAVTGSDFSFYPDVETFMSKWTERYDYITTPTNKLLIRLKELELKATFFIVADIITYYPKLVNRILEDGHELGCHSLHHEISIHTKTKQPVVSKDNFEQETGKAREMLQRVSGQKIEGYRAPGAYISQWMLESLINMGFKYDSSVNPNSLFNKTDLDLSAIDTVPYKVETEKGTLIEIPWPNFHLLGLRFPTAGGPFLRFFPSSYISRGLQASQKRGDTVFYFHSLDVAEEKLPGLASSNSRRPFYFNTSGKKTFSKLDEILLRFKSDWVTCGEVAKNTERSLNGHS